MKSPLYFTCLVDCSEFTSTSERAVQAIVASSYLLDISSRTFGEGHIIRGRLCKCELFRYGPIIHNW